ncbi:MAG: ribosome biogenesis GTPase YlqF [Clostridiales bacterium]|nr:ribosome biogenesis GTPase YlqF [Clostridiales bacterium]MBS5877122.1 ribosome biogenesis GTPase YlqF [Clostridiales bacterium]MDU0939037.1 ribosome biogenesis GTPase YlqF [Clostridiales bacterium]MDU1041828.1 ribosome biogenesis GTPase YlqF [Clostridiales bacterium]MDU3490577.1 ribosome biogenesis GTPase YlqF [Clostridiales bacterium]
MNNYQWYPGHMTKALRAMQEDIKLIDVVLELTDARAPESTRNPNIADLAKGKIHILLLNKKDMADEKKVNAWLDYYKAIGIHALAIDAKQKSDIHKVNALIDRLVDEKASRATSARAQFIAQALKKAGAQTERIMVSGIPNVGKSTFINSFSGRASTKTGNKPGVTRGKQWIRIRAGRDLLDTPGVLYVRPTSEESGMRLAFIGSLNDKNLNLEELALDLLKWTLTNYPGMIADNYGIEESEPLVTMEAIGIKRGAIKKGGVIDYERTAKIILDDFRSSAWGRITLEEP